MREVTREAEAIRDRLQQVEGVHKSLLLGERTRTRLSSSSTSLTASISAFRPHAIFNAIEANNQPRARRALLTWPVHECICASMPTCPIRTGRRRPDSRGRAELRLSDLATIRRGYEDPPSYLVRARGGDAVLLGVVMQKGENGLALVNGWGRLSPPEQRRLPLGMSADASMTNQARGNRRGG